MSDRAPNMWELDTMLAERPKGKIRRVSRSSVLGINFDMDLPRSSQTLKPQSNEAGNKFFLENRAFDSDDSIKDPDFNSLCSSTTIDSRTNDEIISQGSHIEESLETRKPKSINKKVRYLRGKHTPSNKIDVKVEDEVKKHISSFPAYESHYSRRDTTQKYLPSSLNLSVMYRLYKLKVEKPVSQSKYCEIFKTMGLKFKAPNVDTCSTCDTYVAKMKIAQTEEEKCALIEQKNNHLIAAEMAFESKRNDKKVSMTSTTMMSFAFDLQQCLQTPFLRNSISFYKRQLWTFNLTVYDLATNNAKCFMWHEAMARRGGNEIASCLYKLLKMLPAETKTVTFYSDSCSGQNKNSFVSAMFILFISNVQMLDYIDHKFLEPGHTHMECDSDHALIERMKKKTNVEIETPRDWYQFVNTIGNKMQTVEMQNNDFYNFSDFSKSKFSWKRVSEDGEKFVWNKVRWLRYTKSCNEIQYKTSLDKNDSFKILKVGKRGVNGLNGTQIQILEDLPCISCEKKKDLMDLKQFINPQFHSFYDNLSTSTEQRNTHPDLTEHDSEQNI